MATIRDVAAAAGVAPSTVSYILRGKKRYPAATVERVMASIAELGYRPDSAARALALGRTNILGFLASVNIGAPDADIDIFMRFMRAALYAARPRGYDVLAMGRGEDELQGDVLADALVVMDILHADPRLPVLRGLGIPTVLIGNPPDSLGLSAVDLDFAGAAQKAVDRLADLGHRQIVVMATPDESDGREFAYRRRFREAFLQRCESRSVQGLFIPCGLTRDAVGAWLDGVQTRLPQVSGVVVMAVGVLDLLLEELARRNRVVPDDLSLLALAPAEDFARSFPAISVLDIPGHQMVDVAVNRALDELGGAAPGVLELVPTTFHDRGSLASRSPR
ncbi:LacI family DNA-binding transcriptional regulator [Kineosporia babensis]|uniref:LacI family transcriptional regulator n=1 Tax=Kineosporia babensis TaxID=499548 RepID=A0A9X1NNH2_9ACTN|nr:LacI family DNA-binding transcriptional regulator [Kineosporia babensis]MCD5316994.1 LacI family transcriptional regulator [Kineosporia babensis]